LDSVNRIKRRWRRPWGESDMKKAIILGTALALAACNGAKTADTEAPEETSVAQVDPDEAGFEAVAPGTYEIVRANGSIDRLIINPGLTWSMVSADNKPSGGTIFAQGGENCFVTEGVEGHRCFTSGPPAADGSMKVTADDGEVATVRPVKS
jgi:hypothetical protein